MRPRLGPLRETFNGYWPLLSDPKCLAQFKILHKHKFIEDKEEKMNYITKYDHQICTLPSFSIAQILNKEYSDVYSKKYLTPIRNLFRDVGILPEKRGKKKSIGETKKYLRKFLVKEYKAIQKKKPLPIKILQKRLEAEINRMFPDEPKEAEKYYWGDSTIRRIVIKK
jgi:hypothetical protein